MESDVKETPTLGWLIFITVFLAAIWYFISSAINIAEVSRNWPKYRCSPSVMPFASLYGYDTAQNFNFCLKAIFEGQVGGVTGPFSTILSSMLSSLMTFLKNLNSMRIMIATLVGGISKVLQEFTDRFKLLFFQIRVSFLKMQSIMNRLFGTFYAIIYMGLSAVQAGQNFSNTFIFRFLDTFCFDPQTLVREDTRGFIPIEKIQVGDIISGKRVTSTYRFIADGQQMVNLQGIYVSTNHYVDYNGHMIQAGNHPDAYRIGPWLGGTTFPLICLDVEDHILKVQSLLFSDWDETEEADTELMIQNEQKLNGTFTIDSYPRTWKYQPAFGEETEILTRSGQKKPISALQLADELSLGRIIGLGKRLVNSFCILPSGTIVTPSTLVWNGTVWERAGKNNPIENYSEPKIFYSVIVADSATLETSKHEYIRDMLEIHETDIDRIVQKRLEDPNLA